MAILGGRLKRVSKSISLLIVLAVCCAAQSFTIRTTGVTGDVQVQYFLTGSFGGFGSPVREADPDGAYRIPLRPPNLDSFDLYPARTLKAIVWSSGCQFQLMSVDLVADFHRDVLYECHPLPTITLSGAISPPLTAAGPLDVEVRYIAFWNHRFFGILDGPVTDFLVAKAPLQSGARFEINIPDFSKDPITTEKPAATLQLRVLEHKSWNSVATLAAPADLRDRNTNQMKILPRYDSPRVFVVGPR